MYQSRKQYGHDLGFSCAFRQWKAKSHCSKLHGYALSFNILFESKDLDEQNFVLDFGAMRTFKDWLVDTFDHKTIVAEDDPQLSYFKGGAMVGIFDLTILPATGCEKFAEYVFATASKWLQINGYAPRVTLVAVTVAEHGSNSATYINPKLDITAKAFKRNELDDYPYAVQSEPIKLKDMKKAFGE